MSINRYSSGFNTGLLGLFVNLILFVSKIVIGLTSGSVAILADAFHSLSDAAGSIITMVGFKVANRRRSKKFPYGYGRIEYVAGMVIGMMIMFTALVVGQASIERFIHPVDIEFSWIFVAILLVSIFVKIGLFFYVLRVNQKIKSGVLSAFARDSLFDALATVLAILPLALASIDFPVDAIIGIVLSIFIFVSGLTSFIRNAEPTLGVAFKSSLARRIRREILQYKSFSRVKTIQLHDYGINKINGTIEVELDPHDHKKAYVELLSLQRSLKRLYDLDATIFWRA